MGIIVLGPLHYYGWAYIELFLPRSGATPECEACVVESLAVVLGVGHTCQTLSMHHITLQWL